jgi:hypothetical protein
MTRGDGCYHLIKHNDGWWAMVDDSAIGPFRNGMTCWLWARGLVGELDNPRPPLEASRGEALTTDASRC